MIERALAGTSAPDGYAGRACLLRPPRGKNLSGRACSGLFRVWGRVPSDVAKTLISRVPGYLLYPPPALLIAYLICSSRRISRSSGSLSTAAERRRFSSARI